MGVRSPPISGLWVVDVSDYTLMLYNQSTLSLKWSDRLE